VCRGCNVLYLPGVGVCAGAGPGVVMCCICQGLVRVPGLGQGCNVLYLPGVGACAGAGPGGRDEAVSRLQRGRTHRLCAPHTRQHRPTH